LVRENAEETWERKSVEIPSTSTCTALENFVPGKKNV